MGKRAKYILFFAYVGTVGALSLWPGKSLPQTPGFMAFAHADKVIHAAMYAIMVVLGACTILPPRQSRLPFGAILFSGGYGTILEFLQISISGVERTASTADAVANLVGALFGALIFVMRRRILPRGKTQLQEEW